MSFYAPEFENCMCVTAGDDKGILISNLNCDGSRIRNLAGVTVEYGFADNTDAIAYSNTFVQPVDQDYVSFVVPSATTATLGGKYTYQVRITDLNGTVTTIGCGCIFIKKCVF